MKVHAFGVNRVEKSGKLEKLLKRIKSDAIDKRIRTIFHNDFRIEDITYNNKKKLWFFDISKFRDKHGPGKASKDTPVEGFDFQEGEVFCEETACLYIPKIKHLIVQYNHNGARIGIIQSYLSEYDESNSYGFEMLPKYDATVERKFRKRAATKSFTVKIDPRYLNNSDRIAGTALSQALELGTKSHGEKVELTISAGMTRGNHLSEYVDKSLSAIRSIIKGNADAVTKLKVGILESLDSRVEVLDLLEQRLVHEFSDIPVGADLRFPLKARYRALERAYNGWKNVLKK